MGPACAGFPGQNDPNYLLPANGDDNGCRNILLIELIMLYWKKLPFSLFTQQLITIKNLSDNNIFNDCGI